MSETTETDKAEYRDLIPVIVERESAVLPEGFTEWGIKSVRPDLRTYGDYQWPYPGNVAVAHDVNEANKGACPLHRGDGLCVATTWRGMASGGIPARTLLLVAVNDDDLLSADASAGKARYRKVSVVALVDGERLLREAGAGADLYGVDLSGAYLRGAYLSRADLSRADLAGADLAGAYLADADLRMANLRGADLYGANLGGANLGGADLGGADLGDRTLSYPLTDADRKALTDRGAIL